MDVWEIRALALTRNAEIRHDVETVAPTPEWRVCGHDAVQSSFAMCPQMYPILRRIVTHRKSRAMRALRLKHLADSGRPYRSEFEPLARLVASRRRAGVSRS